METSLFTNIVLVMQFVKSETTESFVSRTNALLIVGSLISIGDISVSIATAFLSLGGNVLGHIGSRGGSRGRVQGVRTPP